MFRYLSGVCNEYARDLADTHGLGLMLNPRSYTPTRADTYPALAVDNGCFTDRWEEAQWLRYLDRCDRRAIFAVAPDVPFDWEASWARTEPYVDRIRGMGFRVGLALRPTRSRGPLLTLCSSVGTPTGSSGPTPSTSPAQLETGAYTSTWDGPIALRDSSGPCRWVAIPQTERSSNTPKVRKEPSGSGPCSTWRPA